MNDGMRSDVLLIAHTKCERWTHNLSMYKLLLIFSQLHTLGTDLIYELYHGPTSYSGLIFNLSEHALYWKNHVRMF